MLYIAYIGYTLEILTARRMPENTPSLGGADGDGAA